MISLRSLVIEDSTRVFELASNWNVAKTTKNIPHPYPENGANIWIEHTLEGTKKGLNIVKAIVKNDELIGIMGLVDIQMKQGEIGYWLGEEFWGNGYTTIALELFMKYLKDETNIQTIIGCCYENNTASYKLLSRLGNLSPEFTLTIDRQGEEVKVVKFEGRI